MSRLKKISSVVAFLALAVFVLLQYQNCGNSSNTNSVSAVGPSGLTYTVAVQPSTATFVHNSGQAGGYIQVQVASSGAEQMIVKVGYISSGGYPSQPFCTYPTQAGSTFSFPPCYPSFSAAGSYTLYVQVTDYYTEQTQVICESNTTPGCVGTYNVIVQ